MISKSRPNAALTFVAPGLTQTISMKRIGRVILFAVSACRSEELEDHTVKQGKIETAGEAVILQFCCRSCHCVPGCVKDCQLNCTSRAHYTHAFSRRKNRCPGSAFQLHRQR